MLDCLLLLNRFLLQKCMKRYEPKTWDLMDFILYSLNDL